MTLKMKLTSTICAFLLILGLTIMGVMAAPSATVNLGGSISFNATGVNAKVTGEVTGYANEEKPELPELLFQEEYTASEEEDFDDAVYSWGHCDLKFDNSATPIEITVTIENLADRDLYVSATEGLVSVNNLTKTIDNGAFKLAGKETGSMTITLEVTNPNASLSDDATYSFDIDLKDASAIPTADYYAEHNKVTVERVEGEDYAQVSLVDIETTTGDIVVPAYLKVDDEIIPVTHVADSAFINDDDEIAPITSITLPDTITYIGNFAFVDGEYLESAHLGNSVETIGDNAFSGCNSLTSITIPDSVRSIGESAFNSCYSLTSITIPDSVRSIGESAFSGCPIENLVIPEGLEFIGDSAFANCNNLTSVTIPSSVKEIIGNPFSYCTSLETIKVAEGNTVYEDRGLNAIVEKDTNTLITGCKNTTIDDSIEIIGDQAFYYCDNLTSVIIPDSVISIGDFAFAQCSNLTSVVIGNKVETIADQAFYHCDNLTSVVIGNKVETIGNNAFDNCYRLVEIYNQSGVTITETSFGLNASINPDINIYTTEGGSKIINVTGYEDYVFFNTGSGYTLVSYKGEETDITLPSNIDFDGDGEVDNYTIRQNAFSHCDNLTSVTIPDCVTEIGDSAFNYCYSLESVVIGNKVDTIEHTAFNYCTSLTSVVIGNNVETIRRYAFNDCDALTTVYYTGTEEQWNAITIESDNEDLTSADINFEYTGE